MPLGTLERRKKLFAVPTKLRNKITAMGETAADVSKLTVSVHPPPVFFHHRRAQPVSPVAAERLFCYLLPVISNSTLSLRPNLSSGIPDSTTLSLMVPTISLRRTLPLALT